MDKCFPVLIFVHFFTLSSFGQISGPWGTPTSFSVSNTTCGSNETWSSISEVGASDDIYASTIIASDATPDEGSKYLKVKGFGITLSGVCIHGIEVNVEGFTNIEPTDVSCPDASAPCRGTRCIQLMKAGTIVGTGPSYQASSFSTTEGTHVYGHSAELWGTTWTTTDLADPDFGVVLVLGETWSVTPDQPLEFYVDNISISIYYTLAFPCGPLGINFRSLTATPSDNKKVEISWKAENEPALLQYEIERSQDGHSFAGIDKVMVLSDSPGIISRNYTDEAPLCGKSFYRLRLLDRDENFQYSSVAEVSINAISDFMIGEVVPNPFMDQFSLKVYVPEVEPVELSVTDALGKVIWNEKKEMCPGKTVVGINAEKWGAGIYFLRVSNGPETLTRKITKQ